MYSEEQSSSEPSSGFDPETITSLNTSWYDKLLSSPRPLNPEASAFTPSTPFGKEEKTTDKEVEETVTKLKRDKEDFIKKGFGSIVNLPEPYLQEILSKVENEKTGDINAFLGRIQSISRRSGFVAQIKSTGETTERISTELSQIKETIEYSIEKYINQGNFNQFMKEIKPISKNLKRVGDYHLQYLRVNLLPIAKIAAAAEHHLDKSNAD